VHRLVDGEHPAAERGRAPRDFAADVAEPDDADGLAADGERERRSGRFTELEIADRVSWRDSAGPRLPSRGRSGAWSVKTAPMAGASTAIEPLGEPWDGRISSGSEHRRHVGRQRLPGGAPRKASQRKTRRASAVTSRISPRWRAGDGVLWQGRAGIFRRDVGDGEHAEIVITERIYRVRVEKLG